MPKGVALSLLFLTGLLDLQRRASKRLRAASSPVKAAASVSLGTSPPARRQSSRQAAKMPRGAQRGSKSKFVTGGSARRSMSGSDGMRPMYDHWLTSHLAEAQATAKLIQLGPPSDCWCESAQRKESLVSAVQRQAALFVILAVATWLPCIALQQAIGLAHRPCYLSHAFAAYFKSCFGMPSCGQAQY